MKQITIAQTKLCCFIIGVCFLLILITGKANPILAFNQQNFHVWQLISAHFVHYDFQHLSLNMLALVILLYLFPTTNKELAIGFVIAIALIDVFLLNSNVQFYNGFSGLLYVIPGLALARFVLAKRYVYAFMILGIYLVYAIASQQNINVSANITWTPLYQAHLLGFVGGIFAGYTQIVIASKKRNSPFTF